MASGPDLPSLSTEALLAELAGTDPAALHVPPGALIAERYRVAERVGAGGMGVVYRARDERLGRDVAIKVLLDESDEGRQRMLHEATAMARLSHPNIVAAYDVGTWSNGVFLAMELITGTTLRRWLAARPRTWREVLGVFLAAGEGLAAMHGAGLVHRDFKPANVLIDEAGRVRLADLGLARAGDDAPDVAAVGTPAYMAPEQQRGASDARSDQYSFCAAMREALGDAGVPRWLARVVDRGLAADPAARHASMKALLAELARGPLLTPWRLAAAAALVLALGGAAAFALTRRSPCAGAEALLAGTWDETARAAVQRAFAAAKLADGAELVAGHLDAYARSWVAMRTQSCEATRVRHEQSQNVLDARTACLDRRLGALRVLAGVLSDPANVTGSAGAAALQLPAIDDCIDAGALPPWERPAPPEIQARVALLRQRLDQAVALYWVGHARPAASALDAVVDEARQVGHAPLLASALHQSAFVRQQFDALAAERFLVEALVVASEAKDDQVLARVQTLLVYIRGVKLGKRQEAMALAPVAAAAVRRAGSHDRDWYELDKTVGNVLLRTGAYVEGRVYATAARLHAARGFGPTSIQVAYALRMLGVFAHEVGHLVESRVYTEAAQPIFEAKLGPLSYDTVANLTDLGGLAQFRGDFATARRSFQIALERYGRTQGKESRVYAIQLNNLASVNAEAGQLAEARRQFEEALNIGERNDTGKLFPAVVKLQLGDLAVQEGRLADARALIVPGRAAVVEDGGDATVDSAYAWTTEAHLLTAEGRHAEAVALAERALAVYHRAATGTQKEQQALAELGLALLAARRQADAAVALERALAALAFDARRDADARTRFALARALGPRSPRARALAAEARAAWLAFERPDEAAKIDAWLAP